MRKKLALLGACALILIVVPQAFADGAPSVSGGVGYANIAAGERFSSFNGHEAKNGQPAKGIHNFKDEDNDHLMVEISCVEVVGTDAWFGGEILKGSGKFEARVGMGLVTAVHDGSEPSDFDRIANYSASNSAEACAMVAAHQGPAVQQVTRGNLQVRDNT